MKAIDAHIHYGDDHPELLALLESLDLKLLNISFAKEPGRAWRQTAQRYRQLAADFPQRFGWVTSFDLPQPSAADFDPAQFVEDAVAGLAQDFAAGAVGCKVWKNIGMDVRKPDGSFLLVDDPLLTPIFRWLEQNGHTLLAHIGEPFECWLPLRKGSPHYGYYSRNPQWHMYNRPDFPSHQQLMAARDRVLARHRGLRFVGAHLASLEWDVDVLAERLRRHPNLAVDISARLVDLAYQNPARVRQVFLDFPDRILFGTDVVLRGPLGEMSAEARAQALADLRQRYETHFAYLEGTGRVTVREQETNGVGLPDRVLEQVYVQNALDWYPGLAAAG